jgi:hypothetical protein
MMVVRKVERSMEWVAAVEEEEEDWGGVEAVGIIVIGEEAAAGTIGGEEAAGTIGGEEAVGIIEAMAERIAGEKAAGEKSKVKVGMVGAGMLTFSRKSPPHSGQESSPAAAAETARRTVRLHW